MCVVWEFIIVCLHLEATQFEYCKTDVRPHRGYEKSTLLCQMLNITKVRIFMLMLIPFPNIFLQFLLSAHYVHFLSLFSFPSDLRLIAQYSPSSTHSPAYPYFAFMPSIFYHLSDRLLMHNPSKEFGF